MPPSYWVLAFVGMSSLAGCGTSATVASAKSPGASKTRTYVEETPYGRRVVTVTTTTTEAPPPPARPGDPLPADPLVRHNLNVLNAYRHRAGLAPVVYDAKISSFAHRGSLQLSKDHTAHAHFRAHAEGAPGFGSRCGENQGDPHGVAPMASDPVTSGKKQIDLMLKLMYDEGPGGGHYDNMMNPKFRRVGIGLAFPGGLFYMTNDFSD
jgi:uncharacterized protein YkwD